MTWQMLVFFVVLALTLALLVTYVVRRAAWAARLGTRAKRALLAGALALVIAPIALRVAGFTARNVANGLVAELGFGLGLTVLIAAAFLIPFDVLRAAVRRVLGRGVAVARDVAPSDDTPSSVEPPEAAPSPLVLQARAATALLSRRELLARSYVAGAIGVGATTSLYGIAVGRRDYVVEQVPIPLRGLPRALDGYTIVQLSDVHVGTFVGERELAAAIDLVRSARPDLIVMTGDLVDNDPRYAALLGRFARRLSELGARDGVVAIPGNHDYYAGVEVVLDALRAGGARVLRNDGVRIGDRGGSFALLGVDDVWAPRGGYGPGADLTAALRSLGEDGERDGARVLLCHNPEFYPLAAPHVDLQLSGHTHGGQLNFLVRPADLVLRHGYIAGHYFRGDSQIYVNRGFGTAGPPARVGAPPEVSRIVLTSA